MKTINFLLFFLLVIGCHSQKMISQEDSKRNIIVETYIYLNGPYLKYSIESASVTQTIITSKKNIGGDNPFESVTILGYRKGNTENKRQEGKWETFRFFKDELDYNKEKKYLVREEYFKNGLRDSIYKIYNKEGKVIYLTTFKNGNGVEKDFYDNGQLYYEIKTQNGYFIDTLKLYNPQGKIMKKLFYKKDSLVFDKKYD